MVDRLVGQVPLVFIVVWDLKDSFFLQFLDCLIDQVPLVSQVNVTLVT